MVTPMEQNTTISKVKIIYEDAEIIAFDKPAGWETIVDGDKKGKYCFTSRVREELAGEHFVPCHRLDRDTSGVQVFAKNPYMEQKLLNIFKNHDLQKDYLALCLGSPPLPQGSIRRNLSAWQGGHRPVQVVKIGGVPALTEYELVAKVRDIEIYEGKTGALSLVCFRPEEGRTHQIRVHAASMGIPILGDGNYGDRQVNKAIEKKTGLYRQALHCYRIVFQHPILKRSLSLTAPFPDDMRKVMDLFVDGTKILKNFE